MPPVLSPDTARPTHEASACPAGLSPIPPPLPSGNLVDGPGARRGRGLTGLLKRRRKRTLPELQVRPDLASLTPQPAPRSLNLSSPSGQTFDLPLDIDVACWMAYLPDDVNLAELYLPGTHQSLALHYPLLSSICQSTPLTAQLRAGIRVLDLRFALCDDGALWAYHGVVSQRKRADEALDEVYAWLESDQGARECVIVSCKQENAAPGFAPVLWALLDRTPRSRAIWFDEDRWPALGEVRGRCVMFCRFGWETRRGLHPPIWPNDSPTVWCTSIGGRDTVVQDWYGLSTPLALPQKAALVLSLFSPAPSSPRPPGIANVSKPSSTRTLEVGPLALALPLRISFLSCASFPLLYPSVAARGLGLPTLGLGFRGVNALVLRGLLRQRARADACGDAGACERGRTYARGDGGMLLLMDFWECTVPARADRTGGLVSEIVRMNFA
ncbi:hypothetical protein JCM3770_004264 [Rhodotorula araucariae]